MSSRSVVIVVYVAGGYTVTTLMPLSLKNCLRFVNSNHTLWIAVTHRNQKKTCSKVKIAREEPPDKH